VYSWKLTPKTKGYNMTVEELKDVIVYLQGRIEELEGKKLCECAEEPDKTYRNVCN
jgi:hypothetical protein